MSINRYYYIVDFSPDKSCWWFYNLNLKGIHVQLLLYVASRPTLFVYHSCGCFLLCPVLSFSVLPGLGCFLSFLFCFCLNVFPSVFLALLSVCPSLVVVCVPSHPFPHMFFLVLVVYAPFPFYVFFILLSLRNGIQIPWQYIIMYIFAN